MIIFMPIVHFWYLTWVMMAMPFVMRASWIVLSASMVFYFEANHQQLTTGVWLIPDWVPYAVYGPFVVAVLVEAWARRRRRTSSA